MSDVAITTRALTKQYGDRHAVDSLSISVPAGRVTGFVGPNGAGKTTTIRMLLGLIRPSAGAAEILGGELGRNLDFLKDVGALIDGPAFYPALSGRDNLRVLATLGRLNASRVDEVLALTGLTDRADDRVSSYSLGMRQRLGIAAALLPDPALVILDEPTNGLDPAGIQDTRRLLRTLAEGGATVFVSSHQLSELEQVCDHLVFLRQGRVIYQGPMTDLLQRRASQLIGRPEYERQLSPLADLVRGQGHDAQIEDGAVVVAAPAEWAGVFNRLAARHEITLVELRAQTASLESTFFALTGKQEEC